MENFQVIELQRQRDFGRKVNATFEFIKQNFGPLFKSILIIAGPPVLIGSLLLGSFFAELMGMSQMSVNDPLGYQNYLSGGSFWLKLSMMFVFVLISGMITIATINNYIILYGEKRTNKIEVSEVWERVRETFWMYTATMILFALLFVVVYAVLLIPVFVLGAISPVLIFFGVLITILGLFYLFISVSLTFIIRAYEKKGFFEALARSFKLVQNKWWSTFGLIFILYMIMMVISYIPIIPLYAILIVNAVHNVNATSVDTPSSSMQIWITVFFAFYYLLQMILNTLPNVGIAFQYFNLVELKEAKGLMNDIADFGKPQDAIRPEENF
jgi:hypothetical protein